jgi:hypothetical protein
VGRDDDDRHGEQAPLRFDTAELRHSHIGDDAACLDRGRNLQEGIRRRILYVRAPMPADPSWKASARRTASSSSITWTTNLSAGIAELLPGEGT